MQRGFTLIQISILLTIASLVLVTLLPSARTHLDGNKATEAKLQSAFTSLRQYQAATGVLPCPADASQPVGAGGYGIAAASSGLDGNCTGGSPASNYADAAHHVAIGMLPVRTLGLANDAGLDGYGRAITYAVDTNATSCWPSSSLAGQLSISDNGEPSNSVASLVSHGADGHGAWIPLTGATGAAVRLNAGSLDADQLINAHLDAGFNPTATLTHFVKKNPTPSFDDLVVYKNPLWSINALPKSLPTILSVTPPADGTYGSGQTLSFTVTYSSPVTVTTTGGTPYLSLSAITGDVGTSNLAKATYQSGSGTTSLTFNYMVTAADSAPGGLTMTSSVTLSGGSIQSGNACAGLGFTPHDLSRVIIGQLLYASHMGDNRVEVFGAASGAYARTIGSSASLQTPLNFSIDSGGNLWIANYGTHNVTEFSASGAYLGSYGSEGPGNGQFEGPCCTSIDASGHLWVTDRNNSRIQKFNIDGGIGSMTWMAQLGGTPSACTACLCTGSSCPTGPSGSGNGQFYQPMGVAFDAAGNIWVADFNNNRIQEFDASGHFLKVIDDPNNGHPTSFFPGQLAFDSAGNLWVVDGNLEKLDPATGAQLANYWTGNPSWLGTPTGLSYDPGSGNVFIGDTSNHQVTEMTTAGALVRTFGSAGTGNGQFSNTNNYGIFPLVH